MKENNNTPIDQRATIECESCGIEMFDTEDCREEMEIHEAECSWTDDARERFDVGDRVQFSDFGLRRLDEDQREGKVHGFHEDRTQTNVRVSWDDRKTLGRYAHSFIKHVESED